jgi:hypothetical protein
LANGGWLSTEPALRTGVAEVETATPFSFKHNPDLLLKGIFPRAGLTGKPYRTKLSNPELPHYRYSQKLDMMMP